MHDAGAVWQSAAIGLKSQRIEHGYDRGRNGDACGNEHWIEAKRDVRMQLERQAEVMARQAEGTVRQRERSSRTDKLIDNAADFQKSASAFQQESVRFMRQSRLMMFLDLPLTIALIALICWLAVYRVSS